MSNEFTEKGTSVQSYYGKRSLPDDEGNELNFQWARIIQILHEMDEHFHRLGAEQSEDDCRKRLVCKLFEEHNDSKDANHTQARKSHQRAQVIIKSYYGSVIKLMLLRK